jgi:hypothetical protein
MKTEKFVLFAIFCLAATISAAAQQQISREEFYRQFYAANTKTSETTHREIVKEESYKAGKVEKTSEILDEFVTPDRRHYVYVSKIGGKDNLKFELIQIGSTYYCRDEGKWRKSESWCANGSVRGGIPDVVSSEFTSEEAKLDNRSATLYRQNMTYKNTYTPGKVLSYLKENFWISADGLLLRFEIEYGTIKPPEINTKFTHTYEYDPKIKIVAPVVGMKKKPAK